MEHGQQQGGWFSEEEATFGDRMAGARDAEGMSQADLARRLGVKLKSVRNWENDLSEPRANNLMRLSGVLNVSLRWLLTGEGEGVDQPDDPDDKAEHTPEIRDLLLEIRDIRGQMTQSADRLARLEKKLRKRMETA